LIRIGTRTVIDSTPNINFYLLYCSSTFLTEGISGSSNASSSTYFLHLSAYPASLLIYINVLIPNNRLKILQNNPFLNVYQVQQEIVSRKLSLLKEYRILTTSTGAGWPELYYLPICLFSIKLIECAFSTYPPMLPP